MKRSIFSAIVCIALLLTSCSSLSTQTLTPASPDQPTPTATALATATPGPVMMALTNPAVVSTEPDPRLPGLYIS
jgi:PBP1b-binding outer membrane lipoprotein LpoB